MTSIGLAEQPLEGRSLLAVRIVWLTAAAAALVILAAALPAYFSAPKEILNQLQDVGLEAATPFAVLVAMLEPASAITSLILSGILFWRGDRRFMVVFTSLYLLGYSVIITDVLETATTLASNPMIPVVLPAIISSIFSGFATTWLFLIFPNGRYVPRWTRYLILPMFVISTLFSIVTAGGSQIETPLEIVGAWIGGLLLLGGFLMQVVRYFRVSTHSERQQTKWALIGVTLTIALFAAAAILASTEPFASNTYWFVLAISLWALAKLPLPLALAISVISSRLWNVDVVIRRTLTYGSITVLLAITYFGAVAVLQNIFVSLTGQQSPLALVASTLAIAALFNPLRSRVQGFVDRRFYRRKYDAERTLEAFAESLRDEVEIEHLQAALVGVVEETMQPERIGLWVKPQDR